MIAMRVLGFAVGFTLIGYGAAMLFVGSDKDVRAAIANLYLVVFGTLIILAELRLKILLKYFKFLQNGFGLGFFYVFVGFMALSSDWWCYIILAVCCAVGVASCGRGFMYGGDEENKRG